jgi:hypothetical protein
MATVQTSHSIIFKAQVKEVEVTTNLSSDDDANDPKELQ